MEVKNLIVPKTARYFVEGIPGPEIKSVWIVCHGYGQLANYFLKMFETLKADDTLIVAPEGLHRYYVKGFFDRVGASWMTKEDRLDDIKDYVNYLDAVYDDIMKHLPPNCRVNILGFSQGTATVGRWFALGKVKADNLILFAGHFPEDIIKAEFKEKFSTTKLLIATGDEDEFLTQEEIKKQHQLLDGFVSFDFYNFKGKHEIVPEVLMEIKKNLH